MANKTDMQRVIRKYIDPEATVYTDEASAYVGMPNTHYTVNHSRGQCVDGDAYTNSMESFWAVLKRGHIGTRHWWSTRHTHRYVAEYQHRHNTKH